MLSTYMFSLLKNNLFTLFSRYSLYAIQLVGTPPYLLTWLRYSFFIVAYPTGVAGELLCSYAGYQAGFQKKIRIIKADFYFGN